MEERLLSNGGRENQAHASGLAAGLPAAWAAPRGGEQEKVWLVVDWPTGDPEPYHYCLAHLHRSPTKALCLKLSRSRWHIEQYYQRS